MTRSIGMALVVGAFTFVGVACEQADQTGGELEQGAETAWEDTREAGRSVGEDVRQGTEDVEREIR